MLKYPCIPGINLIDLGVWSYLCIVEFGLLVFCWGFCIHVYQGYWPVICVCVYVCGVLVWFWYQGNAGFIKCVWKVSHPLHYFLKNLRRIGVKFFLNLLQNLPVRLSSPRFWLLGDFYFCFSLLTSSQSIQILYFFMIQFWKICF